MVRARFRVSGAGVCLQSPQGDLVTVCGRCAERDGGERTQQKTLADRAGASWRGRSVVRWVAQASPSYSSSQTRTLAVREAPSGPAYFRVSEPRPLEHSLLLLVLYACWNWLLAAANSLSTSSSSLAKSSIICDPSKPSILNVVMRW